ncbi:Mor transcription activator family protein [Roseburia sp. 1XD42-69]|uniref:Mor transcription activator family protein n=1 Tax=Roseburia sp. 1XD42-69 TaxID=2320088 RepID=UPI000EA01752|nr:Mor transcription activator family protein [Roseburia sp. 1XD42-69]RKJ67083.1 Mor transcription activator family protein [Roseburia sp. 1XD42-69]
MSILKKLLDATTEDLAGIYKELAETVGIDNAHEIYLHFKGMQMMFPRRFYSHKYIAQQIVKEREEGVSVRCLVQKYGLCESRVRQILREDNQ